MDEGEYVWVRMGKRDIEQIVYVDNIRYFNETNAPYEPFRVKRVLRKASEEEVKEAKKQLGLDYEIER